MGRGGKFFFDKVYTVTEILAGIAFGVLCAAVGIQVASRYLFGVSFGWAEEFPLFLFLWVCFLAAAVAYRQNSHLGVSLLFDRLPRGFRKLARYLELLLTLAFFLVIFYYELDVALSISSSFVVLKFPKFYHFIGIPVSAVIFLIFIVEKVIEQIEHDFGGRGSGGAVREPTKP
jgi:TRAP-type C4-dicarboxylate transport system permease small subunit